MSMQHHRQSPTIQCYITQLFVFTSFIMKSIMQFVYHYPPYDRKLSFIIYLRPDSGSVLFVCCVSAYFLLVIPCAYTRVFVEIHPTGGFCV